MRRVEFLLGHIVTSEKQVGERGRATEHEVRKRRLKNTVTQQTFYSDYTKFGHPLGPHS